MHMKGKIKDESFKSSSMKALLFPPCTPATGMGSPPGVSAAHLECPVGN